MAKTSTGFKIGETVGYSVAFLKSVQGHGVVGARRGELVSIDESGKPALAKVKWSDEQDTEPKSVLLSNLRPVRTFHLERS